MVQPNALAYASGFNKNIHVQCIDDEKSHTVVEFTTHSDFESYLMLLALGNWVRYSDQRSKKPGFLQLCSTDRDESIMAALKRLPILFERKA